MITQREARTPQVALAALFCRGDLPADIIVTGRYSALSPVRVGERYRWTESLPGMGCYAPQDGGTIHIMPHEVRRNWGRFYAAAVARPGVAA
jgi:hypothetical protein